MYFLLSSWPSLGLKFSFHSLFKVSVLLACYLSVYNKHLNTKAFYLWNPGVSLDIKNLSESGCTWCWDTHANPAICILGTKLAKSLLSIPPHSVFSFLILPETVARRMFACRAMGKWRYDGHSSFTEGQLQWLFIFQSLTEGRLWARAKAFPPKWHHGPATPTKTTFIFCLFPIFGGFSLLRFWSTALKLLDIWFCKRGWTTKQHCPGEMGDRPVSVPPTTHAVRPEPYSSHTLVHPLCSGASQRSSCLWLCLLVPGPDGLPNSLTNRQMRTCGSPCLGSSHESSLPRMRPGLRSLACRHLHTDPHLQL